MKALRQHADVKKGDVVRVLVGVGPTEVRRFARAQYEEARVVAVSVRRVRLASVEGFGQQFSIRASGGGWWQELRSESDPVVVVGG
jgi:D-arabinose 1-dehydrogenase-like Zn-dependent alcohol dehydrogenase